MDVTNSGIILKIANRGTIKSEDGKTIKRKISYKRTFTSKPVTTNEVYKLLKKLDAKKAIGIDGIPPMILRLSAHILAEPLTKIINKCIVDSDFPTIAKLVFILSFFKKGERSQ